MYCRNPTVTLASYTTYVSYAKKILFCFYTMMAHKKGFMLCDGHYPPPPPTHTQFKTSSYAYGTYICLHVAVVLLVVGRGLWGMGINLLSLKVIWPLSFVMTYLTECRKFSAKTVKLASVITMQKLQCPLPCFGFPPNMFYHFLNKSPCL